LGGTAFNLKSTGSAEFHVIKTKLTGPVGLEAYAEMVDMHGYAPKLNIIIAGTALQLMYLPHESMIPVLMICECVLFMWWYTSSVLFEVTVA
jgi:hypothetical protein